LVDSRQFCEIRQETLEGRYPLDVQKLSFVAQQQSVALPYVSLSDDTIA